MKKIINGKVYDTDKAKLIGTYANGGSWSDFTHLEERLYQKRTGEFFLAGSGGAATKYAVSIGQNGWTGGAKIIPVSYAKAREWAEEKMPAEEYEREFGAVTEDETTTVLSISLPMYVAEKIRAEAKAAGMTLSAYIASKF